MAKNYTLPLRYATSSSWAKSVLTKPHELLSDHAHLERKAAQNALELVSRWPKNEPSSNWLRTLCAIARDEVQHFSRVVKLLEKRGGKLSRTHKNFYAQNLRKHIRLGLAERELLDRLLASALIELRSCERFALLAEYAEEPDLKSLYRALWTSEHGHYKIFFQLAEEVISKRELDKRWDQFLDFEVAAIKAVPAFAGMHSADC